MIVALSDLITAQTPDQMMTTIINIMVSLGITSAPNWRKGAVSRSVLRTVAIIGSGFSSLAASLASSGFRDLAKGSWLTLWARSVYNVERPLATFAAGVLTLTNTGGGTFSKNPGEVTVLNSATGKTYVNTASFSLGAGPSSVDVNFQAVEQGSASSAAPGAIDTLETTLLNVTVTNALAFVGTDDATDDELGELALSSLGAMSPNGAPNAFEYLSISDPTTVPVLVKLGLTTLTSQPITRVGVASDGSGGTNVYLATAAGPASGGDVAIVNVRLQAACRPFGIKVTTAPANPITVPISYEAWLFKSSLDNTGALNAFASKLVSYFTTVPLGGIILPPATSGVFAPNAVEGALFQATPGVVKAVVSSPASDLALTPDQVAVLGTVTGTVHLT